MKSRTEWFRLSALWFRHWTLSGARNSIKCKDPSHSRCLCVSSHFLSPPPRSFSPFFRPTMDSELTLVNPSPPTPYFLSSMDLKDTVIYARPSEPLYKITSTTRHISICDGAVPGRTIAVLHRRELLSDTISFPHRGRKGGRAVANVSIQRWLKRCKALDGT